MDADTVLREWLDRSGEYSPRYYAYYGPNRTSEAILERLESVVDRDAAVLELGCSSGRHLSYLHRHGYGDLHGIDLNGGAFDVMADAFPDLAEAGTFYSDAIEAVVTGFDDRAFDVVYSVETLQHIHHDNEWVFEEIARVTDDLLVTAEIEGDGGGPSTDRAVTYVDDDVPLYYRNWGRVFEEFGFVETATETVDRDTLRAFRRAE